MGWFWAKPLLECSFKNIEQYGHMHPHFLKDIACYCLFWISRSIKKREQYSPALKQKKLFFRRFCSYLIGCYGFSLMRHWCLSVSSQAHGGRDMNILPSPPTMGPGHLWSLICPFIFCSHLNNGLTAVFSSLSMPGAPVAGWSVRCMLFPVLHGVFKIALARVRRTFWAKARPLCCIGTINLSPSISECETEVWTKDWAVHRGQFKSSFDFKNYF